MLRLTLVVLAICVAFTHPLALAEDAPIEDVLRGTFRISNGSTVGTGFIVVAENLKLPESRKFILVSAAHVFDDMKSAESSIAFRAKKEDGTFVRTNVKIQLRDEDRPRWVRHPELDVAAMFVELPKDVDCQPFAYQQLSDEQHRATRKVRVGQEVFVPCFPAQLVANQAGWPVLRKGSIATHPLLPIASAKTIFIDYTIFGGDSGAPVVAIVDGKPLVIGLVSGMQRQTDKTTTPFEQRTVHTPLGLAIVVQSPFLRDTVDLLLRH